jgi:glycosyltransferase involved in cell wall biosynthesis
MRISMFYLGRKGAGNIYSLEMAKSLSRLCTIQVIIASESENIGDWRSSGLNLVEVDTYNEVHTFRDQFNRIKATLNINKFIKLKKIVNDFNPDFIYHTMIYTWLPIINFIFQNRKIVFTLHDPILHTGENQLFFRKLNTVALKKADKIVILSDIFKKTLTENGVSRDKIVVIPHGNFKFYKDKNFCGNEGVKNTLLFFGRVSKYKGIGVLLDAFKLIKNSVKDAKLIIAGEGNIEEYRENIDSLKDIELINRWISDEEIGSIFGRADYVILPYIDASQSGVIPVAYAFGMPVIATRTGGIPEQVIENKTGYMVSPGDAVELAEKCIYLLKNPDLIKKMGAYAKEVSETKMNWDTCANKLIVSIGSNNAL